MCPSCPTSERLLAFSLGKLSEEEAVAIAAHLDDCVECENTVTGMDQKADTLVSQLGEPAVLNRYDQEPQCAEALERVKAMGTAGVPSGVTRTGEEIQERPSRLGEYELLAKLGEGGMGTVYKARQTRLDKFVAIKVLPKARTGDPQARARFEREMRAVGRVSHSNIVQAYDARDIEGTTILVMEFADGKDLSQIVGRQGALSLADACEVIRQAALGLQCAHQNGLVHRDIKPSNLMLTQQGVVKILDLGLARLGPEHGGGGELTSEGQAMGTADYIAPEQTTDSHAVDIRADIYSLGCTLYKLLTGHAPYSGPKYDNPIKKMFAHLQEPIPSVRDARGDVPAELAAILERMMAKDREARYPTPADVAEALAPFAAGCSVERLTMEEGIETMAPRAGITAPGITAPQVTAASREARPKPAPLPQPAPRRTKPRTIAVALGCLGLVILLGIVIRIRDKSGKETLIPVPEGAQVTIEDDGSGKEGKSAPSQAATTAPEKAMPEGPANPGPAVLADKEKPFVVLHADGKRDEYKYLSGLLPLLHAGDIVEVHGNGPFKFPPVILQDKGLTLRAAPGYRPRLVLAKPEGNNNAVVVHGPLAITGCDLTLSEGSEGCQMFSGDGGPCEFRACRCISRSTSFLVVWGEADSFSIRDCLVVNAGISAYTKKVELENNVIFLGDGSPSALGCGLGQTVRLIHNTIFVGVKSGGCVVSLYGLNGSEIPAGAAPTTIEAVGNLFYPRVLFHTFVPPAKLKDALSWRGRGNLYVGPVPFVNWQHTDNPSVTECVVKDFAAWKDKWGGEEGSLYVERMAFQSSVFVHGTPEQAMAWLRERAATIRKQLGPKVKDFGPRWDLIGPGDAYVRALAAAGPPLPKDRLRPPAPEDGPFVVLRQGKKVKAYPTFQQAAEGLKDADTIEILTDGPTPGCSFSNNGPALQAVTLRASPGYCPVITSDVYVHQGFLLTVEGLEFRNARLTINPNGQPGQGGVARLVNCSFLTPSGSELRESLRATFDSAAANGRAEIQNCMIPHPISAMGPTCRVAVDNSILGAVWADATPPVEKRIEVRQSILGTPGIVDDLNGLPWQFLGVPKVAAQGCLLDSVNQVGTEWPLDKAQQWQGNGNVYALSAIPWPSLERLRAEWKSPETDSVEADSAVCDPTNWRLLPSSPGYHAGPDGKDFGADVDRVAVVTPESVPPSVAKPAAEKPESPAKPAPAPLADKEKPIVLLHADGRRDEFKHLSGALAVLQASDAIEVHGNGPFLLDQVVLKDKPLTLRAAPGYRPRFVEREGTYDGPWFNLPGVALSIEGCDFQNFGRDCFVGGGHPWKIHNCRIVRAAMWSGTTLNYDGPELLIRDSFLSALGRCAFRTIHLEPKATLDLSNSIIESDWGCAIGVSLGGQTVRLRNNLFFGNELTYDLSELKKDAQPVQFEVRGNVFNSSGMNIHAEALAQSLVRWKGENNLYAKRTLSTFPGTEQPQGTTPKDNSIPKGLAGWNKLCKGAETGSKEVDDVRFRFGRMRWQSPEATIQDLRQIVADLRQSGRAKADFGPNLDLLGPGDAYVRALAAAGKPVAKEQLRPESPEGGPCVLIREGQVVRGYLSLQQVADAAQSGDVVEIRSDGPLKGCTIVGSPTPDRPKSLVVRAAPGYRPVLEGSLEFSDGTELSVEGLHFHSAGLVGGYPHPSPNSRLVRVANCSFEGQFPDIYGGIVAPNGVRAVNAGAFSAEGRPAEIVNCLITGSFRTNLAGSGQLDVRNSLVESIDLYRSAAQRQTVNFEHSAVIGRYGIYCEYEINRMQLQVSARSTLFDLTDTLIQRFEACDVVAWKGEGNVYRLRRWPWCQVVALNKGDADTVGLEAWQKHWQGDADSSEADPSIYDPRQWKFLPRTPGEYQGPDGRDFGPDFDRIAATPGNVKVGVETFPRRSETPPSPGDDGDRRAAEWVLSLGGYGNKVTIRAGEQERDISLAKDLPAGTWQLSRVELREKGTDEGLVNFKGLTRLTGLLLCGPGVTNAGLAHLGGLNNLDSLILHGTSVTDAGLEHLKSLPKLQSLTLQISRIGDAVSGNRVGDAGLRHLKELPKLWYLDLSGQPVTDAGLEPIASLTSLENLELGYTRVSDAGLKHLQGLTNLKGLGLDGTSVSDAGLEHLKALPKLASLCLRRTRVTDAALPLLVTHGAKLRLEDARISAKGFADLKVALPGADLAWSERNHTAAEAVLAAGGKVSIRSKGQSDERLVKAVAELPAKYFQVARVDLTDVSSLPDGLFVRLAALNDPEFDNLESLDLSGSPIQDCRGLEGLATLKELSLARTKVSDAGLEPLKELKELRRLVLDGSPIAGPGLVHLKGLPKLTELRLACPTLGDLGARTVGQLKTLQRLSLAGTGVSDAGLEHLHGLTHLQNLDLSGTKITEAGRAALHTALPNCRLSPASQP